MNMTFADIQSVYTYHALHSLCQEYFHNKMYYVLKKEKSESISCWSLLVCVVAIPVKMIWKSLRAFCDGWPINISPMKRDTISIIHILQVSNVCSTQLLSDSWIANLITRVRFSKYNMDFTLIYCMWPCEVLVSYYLD